MNVYMITDPAGASAPLTPGQTVVTWEQRIDTQADSDAHGGAVIGSYVAASIQIAYGLLDGFDDDQLARWKIARSTAPDLPPALPAEVPMYKVEKYLAYLKATTGADYWQAIQNAVAALPEPNRTLALIDLNKSPNLVVNSDLAMGVKGALSLSDSDYAALILGAFDFPG